jgi:hypothetical protein
MVFGIASWRGAWLACTDGMCLRCTARFRRDWNLPELKERRVALGATYGLARAATVVFVAATFTMAANRLDDARTRETMTAPPETVLVPPAPLSDEPARAIASRPRRAASGGRMVARGDAPLPTLFAHAPFESIVERPESPTASLTLASLAEPDVDDSTVVTGSVRRGSPAMGFTAVAAVPHAGLMQQAP